MTKYYLDLINASAKTNAYIFAQQSDGNYQSEIESVTNQICSSGKRLIMLSGPSSSGKTTTAKKIVSELKKRGYGAHLVSLDDFYLADRSDYPLNEDGTPDYESPDALDIDLIISCFRDLYTKGSTELPIFDFNIHSRSPHTNLIKAEKDSFVIVEGIHGLNPRIVDNLDRDIMAKLYVSVSSRIYDNHNNIIFRKRDIRFVRRMVRDYYFRSTSVAETFRAWPLVCEGEGKYIFPYTNNADIKIDSFHPCELCLLSDAAETMLNEYIEQTGSADAAALLEKLEKLEYVDKQFLSDDSLLHEFLG